MENPKETRLEVETNERQESKTLEIPGVASIPLDEIRFVYSHSSGPGGQNVNKTSSKARLRWNLLGGRVSEEVAARFCALYPSWVTNEGEVVISNQESRDQPKNKEACLEKLREALIRAATVPKERIPTKPTKGSVRRRLAEKKKHSEKKRERSKRNFDGDS
ncbi:MAG: aminoacyl-tRNA hydrolase [Thermoguttaceae bacterium]|nr:aminoacyl-tRNA hydrolase [Thermoguttaceae bacterium]